MKEVPEAAPPALPWLPWYALDWLNSPRVLAMTHASRDAYFWLINLQWRDESLPGKAAALTALLPRTVSHKAAASLLDEFFPVGRDGRRRNKKLAALRIEAITKVESSIRRTEAARQARLQGRKAPVTVSVTEGVTEGGRGNVTETSSSSPPPSQAEKKEGQTDSQGGDVDFATELKVTANAALRDNPSLQTRAAELGGYVQPIRSADVMANEWKDFPRELVLQAIADTCRKFVSTPENPRIGSFRYFDAAVRKACTTESQTASETALFEKLQSEHEAAK